MDIVFVHGNYPGQFKHLAHMLAGNKQNRVYFLTSHEINITGKIPNIEIRRFKSHRDINKDGHHYLSSTEEAVIKGQSVIRALASMIEENIKPRLIITHGGMGYGLFIKDLLPGATHIGYFEWYFTPTTTINLLENYNIDDKFKTGMRNLPIIQELDRCDTGVVPTLWQKSQFPINYQSKLKTIFDGIDDNFFRLPTEEEKKKLKAMTISNRETMDTFKISSKDKVISYATRGMEPLRGFPEFMKNLPNILERDEDIKILIAGKDKCAYSYQSPTENGSWKEYMMGELGNFKGKERVIFTGLLTYEDYRKLLWRTNLHFYLTRPYVTSWSLFEAAYCGCNIALNKNGATAGIVEENSVLWVELEKLEEANNKIAGILSEKNKELQGAVIKSGYSLKHSMKKWVKLLQKEIERSWADGRV